MTNLFFLFIHNNEIYITDSDHVQGVPKPRELVRRFSTIEQIRDHALYLGIPVKSDTARERTKHHTPEGIERIREAKLGDNHPAVQNGRGAEFREKVSRTMTGTRGGENNPMWGRRHSKETRQKMHQAAALKERRRWCVSPTGKSTTIAISEPLPDGWQWGRFYDKYRPDPERLPE